MNRALSTLVASAAITLWPLQLNAGPMTSPRPVAYWAGSSTTSVTIDWSGYEAEEYVILHVNPQTGRILNVVGDAAPQSRSFTIIGLEPNQPFHVALKVVSDHSVTSEVIATRTLRPRLIIPTARRVVRSLWVSATSYCLSGHTALGAPVGVGVVAVDPRVIPLGSHLWIPGYGPARALDTGSAIVGPRIDLWKPSCQSAIDWGVRRVAIEVLGGVWRMAIPAQRAILQEAI
ncbi:MAG: 3D domain-containing protein [Patescibacteria group bacterium]|nr:3D domain-containing protein [Patescibacteria group bacterium]